MIDRRAMATGAAAMLFGMHEATAQPKTHPPHVGFIAERRGRNEFEESFLRGLRERGLIDGENVLVDFRYSGFDMQRLRAAASELVAMAPVVIVASDLVSVRTVHSIDSTMAIVHPAMSDPILSEETGSLARPDRNITGASVLATELGGKRVELLKEAVPNLQRIGVLFNVIRPLQYGAATRAAAEELGLTVFEMRPSMPDGIEAAFLAASRDGVQAVVVVSDTSTITYRAQLSDAALKHRIPSIYANRTYLRGGGLMSYGPDLEGAFYRAAYFVERILKGARPADLPIEQAATFQLTLNQRAARALDFKFPQALLLRADEVIN